MLYGYSVLFKNFEKLIDFWNELDEIVELLQLGSDMKMHSGHLNVIVLRQ